jgi:hypothetical protein
MDKQLNSRFCGSLWGAIFLSALAGLGGVFTFGQLPHLALVLVLLIPIATFMIAAPGHMSLAAEMKIAGRELEAMLLSLLLRFKKDGQRLEEVRNHHQKWVQQHYASMLKEAQSQSKHWMGRFHYGRQIANVGALWLTALGLLIPVTTEGFTYGPMAVAPIILVLDGTLLWVASRIILGRIAVRLWDGMSQLQPQQSVWERSFCSVWAPFAGGIFGALGGVIMGQVMAVASTMETLWLYPQVSLLTAAQESLLSFTFLGIVPAAMSGAMIGAMLSLSLQSDETSS